MRTKIFLLSLLAILGVSIVSVSAAEVPPGFKERNFAEDTGILMIYQLAGFIALKNINRGNLVINW